MLRDESKRGADDHENDGPADDAGFDEFGASGGSPLGGALSKAGELIGKYSGPVVMVVVIASAVAVLAAMRQIGMSGGIRLTEIDIDYPLEALTAEVDERGDQVVDELMHAGQFAQVPPERVQMNPFLWKPDPSAVSNEPEVSEEEVARLARIERERSELASLRVQSVMGGKRPLAKISGELVAVGDPVGAMFFVRQIQGRSVTLATAEGDTYTLEMGELGE